MASGTTVDINKVVLPNSFNFGGFYNGVNRNAKNNYNNGKVIIPKFRDGQADKTILSSRYYHADSGDLILKELNYNIDNKRPTTDYFEGRNLSILKTLKGGVTQPTLITVNPRQVIGRV